jgi:dimethylargininase
MPVPDRSGPGTRRAWVREPGPRFATECLVTYRRRVPIDAPTAALQHRNFRQTLERLGRDVRVLPPIPEAPDAVFVEDGAIVLAELSVLGRSAQPTRAGEAAALVPELRARGPVEELPPGATLDGGDVVVAGRRLLVGRSGRTNAEAVAALRTWLDPRGYEVRPVAVRGALHLKTACSALDDGTLLVNPAWLEAPRLAGFRTIPVDAREPFAANVLRVGRALVVATSAPRTAERLSAAGYEVVPLELSEFEKAEGGPSCLCLLDAERPERQEGPEGDATGVVGL